MRGAGVLCGGAQGARWGREKQEGESALTLDEERARRRARPCIASSPLPHPTHPHHPAPLDTMPFRVITSTGVPVFVTATSVRGLREVRMGEWLENAGRSPPRPQTSPDTRHPPSPPLTHARRSRHRQLRRPGASAASTSACSLPAANCPTPTPCPPLPAPSTPCSLTSRPLGLAGDGAGVDAPWGRVWRRWRSARLPARPPLPWPAAPPPRQGFVHVSSASPPPSCPNCCSRPRCRRRARLRGRPARRGGGACRPGRTRPWWLARERERV